MILLRKHKCWMDIYDFEPDIEKVNEFRKTEIAKIDPKKDVIRAIFNSDYDLNYFINVVALGTTMFNEKNEILDDFWGESCGYTEFDKYIPDDKEWKQILNWLEQGEKISCKVIQSKIAGNLEVIKYICLKINKDQLGNCIRIDNIVQVPIGLYEIQNLINQTKLGVVSRFQVDILNEEYAKLFDVKLVGMVPIDAYDTLKEYKLASKYDSIVEDSKAILKIMEK